MAQDRLIGALNGISGILVAPFDDNDRLTCSRLAPIVERNVVAGTHILVANGNTGEFYALTTAEAQTFVTEAAALIGGRLPLLAGIGRSIHDACALARTSAEAGADGLMIHQPPDPFVSPRGIADYINRVRDASGGLPVVLYLRNDAMGAESIADLCRLEGVVGVKWATPNPMVLSAAMAQSPTHIRWVGGLAETWAPNFYSVGARGFTSGLVNVWPEQSMRIHAALEAGDYVTANARIAEMAIFETIRAQEMNGTNVTGVKAALRAMGLDCGAARPPASWPLAPAHQEALARFLRDNALGMQGVA